jgi:sec-independent protein translocase protein TatA
MNIVGLGLPGHSEIILIVFIVLLLFGAKKLPELARSLGKSLSEFKRGQKEDVTQEESAANSSDKSTS